MKPWPAKNAAVRRMGPVIWKISEKKTMPGWRKRLFIATSKFSTDASAYFGLPQDRTVIMGERIEV